MSKYKVGDIVKLRDDLDIGEEYGAVDFLCSMKTLKNKALRIDRIDTDDDGCVIYEIDGWCISEEMIEGLWEECKPKLKLIDVLNMIAKGELKEGAKVKWDDDIYIYIDKMNLIRDGSMNLLDDIWISNLNDEVELIEPPCEHEWKDIETHRMGEGIIKRFRRCEKCGLEEVTEECVADIGKSSEPTKIEELEEGDRYYTVQEIVSKLNEVIRVINKE